jgi:hypothetical protein
MNIKTQVGILFLVMFLSSCTEKNSPEKNITTKATLPLVVGIWKVTDYDNPSKFEDFWELKENGVFNELKNGHEELKKDTLVADESGTWKYESDSLFLTVTSEITNGKRENYKTPQYLNFGVQVKADTVILSISENNRSGQTKRLRLTRFNSK